jgi:hypothetical protein
MGPYAPASLAVRRRTNDRRDSQRYCRLMETGQINLKAIASRTIRTVRRGVYQVCADREVVATIVTRTRGHSLADDAVFRASGSVSTPLEENANCPYRDQDHGGPGINRPTSRSP